MLIFIPSNGRTGKAAVEVNPVKINSLRKAVNYSEQTILRKSQFVKDHLQDVKDFEYLTPRDRDYIFLLLVGSMSMNKLTFSLRCSNESCKTKLRYEIDIEEMNPVFLQGEISCKKNLFGTDYNFRLVSAVEEEQAVLYAIQNEDEFDSRFEDALVCYALDKEVNEESIEWVRSLDLSIYYMAQFFQMCCVHGADISKDIVCSTCNHTTKVVIPIEGDLLDFDMGVFMDRFASISGKVDYKSFVDMTLPEYGALVDALNKKAKRR